MTILETKRAPEKNNLPEYVIASDNWMRVFEGPKVALVYVVLSTIYSLGLSSTNA